MGKVERLCNIVEPSDALFLDSWQSTSQSGPIPDPERRPDITPPPYTRHVLLCMVIVSSILNEDGPAPPPFSYLGM